jgi:hypothetical protein
MHLVCTHQHVQNHSIQPKSIGISRVDGREFIERVVSMKSVFWESSWLGRLCSVIDSCKVEIHLRVNWITLRHYRGVCQSVGVQIWGVLTNQWCATRTFSSTRPKSFYSTTTTWNLERKYRRACLHSCMQIRAHWTTGWNLHVCSCKVSTCRLKCLDSTKTSWIHESGYRGVCQSVGVEIWEVLTKWWSATRTFSSTHPK